ncbi:hypothetical protein BKA70DRAFT_1239695 [Coprinopsis sp. MPI-PUGE-AT-0042]|nr:hypothetical protein BKA70DRAFT_1239695 [Coprinopsis sp. MPI-PUGE-AT-0042]
MSRREPVAGNSHLKLHKGKSMHRKTRLRCGAQAEVSGSGTVYSQGYNASSIAISLLNQLDAISFYMSADSETGSDTDSDSTYQDQSWLNGGTRTVPNLMNTLPNAGSDTLYHSTAHAIPDSNLPLNTPSIRVPAPNPPDANNTAAQIDEPSTKSHWFHAETQSSRGNDLSVRVTASRNLKISASWQAGDSSVNFVVQACPSQVDVNAMQM